MGDTDTVFHIVEGDGGIEIVQLEPVKINVNSNNEVVDSEFNVQRVNTHTKKDNCECVMCIPILEDETKSYAPKNYSRVKIKSNTKEGTDGIRSKSMSTHNNSAEVENTINPPMILKTEPEINIIDSGESTILVTTEPEIEFVDVSGSKKIAMDKVTQNNVQKGPAFQAKPSVSKSQSSEQLEKSSNPRNDAAKQFPSQRGLNFHNPTGPLLELTTRNIKCNICGMVFLKSLKQLQTLKTHFLQHKISYTKVIQTYNGVKYRADRLTQNSNSIVSQPKKVDRVFQGNVYTASGQYRVDKLNVNAKLPTQGKLKNIEQLKEFQINNTTLKRVALVNGKRDSENRVNIAGKNKMVNGPVRAVLPETKGKHIVVQPLAIGKKDDLKTSSVKLLPVRIASSQSKDSLGINFKRIKLMKVGKPDTVPPSSISAFVQTNKMEVKKEANIVINNCAMKSSSTNIKETSLIELPAGDNDVESCNEDTSTKGTNMDYDDDIVIVEQKPELIIIDDNDEYI